MGSAEPCHLSSRVVSDKSWYMTPVRPTAAFRHRVHPPRCFVSAGLFASLVIFLEEPA